MSQTRLPRSRAAAIAVASLLSLGGAAAPALASTGGDLLHATVLHHWQPLPTSYRDRGDKTYPEGIARQHDTPYFYVGSTSDGTVYRGDIHHSRDQGVPARRPGRTDLRRGHEDRRRGTAHRRRSRHRQGLRLRHSL
ncbi:hypothetical protein [Streptomyces sp. NBC_00443]|uniref:hypothetical protein n=1 Tax=Streptomyces sp. NBC_00443 TaxID=2975743 RepID=UPI002E1C040B